MRGVLREVKGWGLGLETGVGYLFPTEKGGKVGTCDPTGKLETSVQEGNLVTSPVPLPWVTNRSCPVHTDKDLVLLLQCS